MVIYVETQANRKKKSPRQESMARASAIHVYAIFACCLPTCRNVGRVLTLQRNSVVAQLFYSVETDTVSVSHQGVTTVEINGLALNSSNIEHFLLVKI